MPAKKSETKKTYVVCGDRRVFGREPGETFTAELSKFDEQRLVAGGHIKLDTGKE